MVPSLIKNMAAAVAASLYMADAALAAVASYEQSGMRFRWGVPSSSDAGLYFSIDAPATHTWAGLGIGEGMRDSTMFLVYADGDGNVTLSTRRGAGYSMPQHMDIAGTELVAGSGVRDGRMVANVRCAGACASGLDLDGGNSWFTAWKAGAGAMDTSNVEAPIQFHDGARVFDVDLSQASIASDANPFVDSSASGGDDNNSAVSSSGGGGGERQTLASAHGVVMSVAFLVLYPIGAMLMPLLGKWLAHGLMQLVAYLTMWAGFGIGIYLSKNGPPLFSVSHKGLGIILVALLGLQPVIGWLHHLHFAKHQKRGIISHVHIWYGRVLMLLGVVNGGLGLRLSGHTGGKLVVAYAVVAAVLGVAYLAAIGFGVWKRRRSISAEQSSSSSIDAQRQKA